MPAFAGMTVGMLLRCRDAFEASGVCCSFFPNELRPNGLRPKGWRAEKRNPMASASVAGRGGRLSARQQALKQREAR